MSPELLKISEVATLIGQTKQNILKLEKKGFIKRDERYTTYVDLYATIKVFEEAGSNRHHKKIQKMKDFIIEKVGEYIPYSSMREKRAKVRKKDAGKQNPNDNIEVLVEMVTEEEAKSLAKGKELRTEKEFTFLSEELIQQRYSLPLSRALTVKENALANIRAMEDLQKAGKLIAIEDVKELWLKISTAVKTRLLSIPAGASQELARCKDEKKVSQILEHHIRNALTEIASQKGVPMGVL